MKTMYHLGLDLASVLAQGDWSWFSDEEGRPVPAAEAERHVRGLLANGVKFISLSDECDRFDPEKGCLGHPDPTDEATEAGDGE